MLRARLVGEAHTEIIQAGEQASRIREDDEVAVKLQCRKPFAPPSFRMEGECRAGMELNQVAVGVGAAPFRMQDVLYGD